MTSAPSLLCAALFTTAAFAQGGSLRGKVEVTPQRFLTETVVYLRAAKAPKAAPRRFAIDQKGLKFIPHVTAITVGDTVEFLNHDAVDHNVFTPDNEGYNLGAIQPNRSGVYTFDQPGVYTQLCSVHTEMLAYVFVGDNPYHAVVDARGTFLLEHVPAGSWTVAIWNSHLRAPDQAITVTEGKTVELAFTLKR